MSAIVSEIDLKRRFADALLRNPNGAYSAANKLGVDHETAAHIARFWINDPEVARIQQELLEEYGPREFLPTREQAARTVYQRAESANNDDFVKMMKLYAEMMGFIEKPGLTINNTNNSQTVTNVMQVPLVTSRDEWERIAIPHQSNLQRIAEPAPVILDQG